MDNTEDFPYKAIISGIPSISRQKFIKKLKETTNSDDVRLAYITRSSAKVSFSNKSELNRLLASGLDVEFGEERFRLPVKTCDVQSPDAGVPQQLKESASVTTYSYDPSDKESQHILRYVSRTPEHKQRLQKFLQQHHIKLTDISEKEVEMEVIKALGIHVSEYMFKRCIEEFLKKFLSWNEKLANCTNDDGTFIIRTLNEYKSKCFGYWYTNTKTILVTGPTDVVEELKDKILQRTSQNEHQRSSPGRRASVFNFSDVPPGVLRFVSKQRMPQLRTYMIKLARIEITTVQKISSVEVTPIPMMMNRLHSEFEKVCTVALQNFFSQFQAWKETFDTALVRSVQRKHPHIFKESSDINHHIKWFLSTGTVTMSGVVQAVQQNQWLIESLMRPSPQKQRLPGGSDRETDCLFDDTPTSPSHRSRHVSSSSDEGATASHRPESAHRRVPYNTEDIPRQVLLFVLKDLKTKKRFEKCCWPNAKAVIRSEKIDDKDKICIYANVLPMQHSTEVEGEAFKAITEFFDQFETQTKKYNKKKLQELVKSAEEIFKAVNGEVHVLYFLDTGTVKVTGVVEKVAEKHEEIERELNTTTYVEKVDDPNVFIAQRECDIWNATEEKCKDMGVRVSISSEQPGKIQFCGNRNAITKAREILGKLSESLTEKQLDGFSEGQINVLRNCEQSQKGYLKTNQNLLDVIYQNFKDKSAIGSISFNDAFISLISTGETQWENANKTLQQFIVSFSVDVERKTNSSRKALKAAKAKFRNDAVFIEEKVTAKQLVVYCFDSQKNETRRKVKEILDDTRDSGKIQHFHEMPEEKAKHFLSRCKIYKAEKVEMKMKNGKHGLLVTCEKEDLDTVEMKLDELDNEIVCKSFHVSGYFLYECLQKSSMHFKIERDTNCSIFFKPTKQAQKDVQISVKQGNILDERCDAIVNSTGSRLSFTSTSQVNKALSKKLGAGSLQVISQTRQSLIKSEADVFSTLGMAPWPYIINVSTPNKNDALTKFVTELLDACNRQQMRSLAIPTIGTGNMGMSPDIVSSCMKAAFEAFCSSSSTKYLKDIRVVVFDANLVPAFSNIVPDSGPTSDGIQANVYANSSDKLNQASDLFKTLCNEAVAKEVIHDSMVKEFSVFIKTQAKEICKGHDVHMELAGNSGQDQCILQGPTDEVRKVKEKIEKLLATGPNWTPMTGKKPFEKVLLDSASSEYKAVKIKFTQSSPSYKRIDKIERIQNPLQYQQFRARKTSKLAGNLARDVSRQLFHGTTPENAESICLYGFNRTYAGKNGTLYGSGVYFHINSCYSVSYGNSSAKYWYDSFFSGQKCMFLADVITGEYTKGSPDLKCAPVNPTTGECFDSVVDNVTSPQIFVVFPDSSCYPSYLITFT